MAVAKIFEAVSLKTGALSFCNPDENPVSYSNFMAVFPGYKEEELCELVEDVIIEESESMVYDHILGLFGPFDVSELKRDVSGCLLAENEDVMFLGYMQEVVLRIGEKTFPAMLTCDASPYGLVIPVHALFDHGHAISVYDGPSSYTIIRNIDQWKELHSRAERDSI